MIFKGVFCKTKYGWGFERFHEPIEFDGDLPASIGETIIGDAGWYRNPPRERLCTASGDMHSVFCPMRGSKHAIADREGSGRVMAYKYFFADWAGARFAHWCKRTGKRILILNSKKNHLYTGHHGCDRLINDNFYSGFLRVFTADPSNLFDVECQLMQDIVSPGGKFLGCSPVVCLNLTGLSDDDRRLIRRIASDMIENEALTVSMDYLTDERGL